MTETEKLESWYEEEKAKGLKYVRFCACWPPPECTVEEFCAEVNRFHEAVEAGEVTYTEYVEDLG